MRRVLVVQLARFGDLLQTKRLLLSIAKEENTETHLCVDPSLNKLAELIYPFAHIHTLSCHATAGMFTNGIEKPYLLSLFKMELQFLADINFDEVYLLNSSPLSYALSALFPPETLRGYLNYKGQNMRSSWSKISSRMVQKRKNAPLNLVDLWAYHHPNPIAPEKVNPIASPANSKCIGIVMAGREARRSLPVHILAEIVQAVFQARGGAKLICLGNKSERPLVRQLIRALPGQTVRCIEDLTGTTSLTDLPEILQGLDRLLTPDTGIMHLAAHLGVPVQGFFLSSAWCFETGPYGLGHTVLQANTECAPCLESSPCQKDLICLQPFIHKNVLAQLQGKMQPDWPNSLLGCVSALDSFGVTYRIVDGIDDRALERQTLRSILAEHVRPTNLQNSFTIQDKALLTQSARYIYEEADWMLPKTEDTIT